MKNIEIKRDKEDQSKLIVEIDLSKEYGYSRTGKTIIIASTEGNHRITTDGVVLGLNCYKYPTQDI